MDSKAVLIVSLGFVVIMGMIFCGIMSVQQQCRCDCCPCDSCPGEGCPDESCLSTDQVGAWINANKGDVSVIVSEDYRPGRANSGKIYAVGHANTKAYRDHIVLIVAPPERIGEPVGEAPSETD